MHDQSVSRTLPIRRLVPYVWLALSVTWAVAILVTDMTGGPLAIWIAATIVPITYLSARPSGGNQTS